jgi:hypothetical protein
LGQRTIVGSDAGMLLQRGDFDLDLDRAAARLLGIR